MNKFSVVSERKVSTQSKFDLYKWFRRFCDAFNILMAMFLLMAGDMKDKQIVHYCGHFVAVKSFRKKFIVKMGLVKHRWEFDQFSLMHNSTIPRHKQLFLCYGIGGIMTLVIVHLMQASSDHWECQLKSSEQFTLRIVFHDCLVHFFVRFS